jgi:molecular chaperone HscC
MTAPPVPPPPRTPPAPPAPPPRAAKAPLIGIDLGTTYSLCAIMQDSGPIILPNALGERLTPSAVSVGAKGEILVGAPARARAATHPDRTALAFKRDMGQDRPYRLADRKLSPQELSAMVLSALKADAEAALGMPVEEAVITVPAYFDDRQRQATRDAGAIAGLKVERIINEPTAAALAYGLHHRHREQKAIVLDLGGGTFDVTVLEIMEGVIEIQASGGDTRLGGEDFVDLLAELVAARLRARSGAAGTGDLDLRAQPIAWARLREAAELAKRRLSTESAARVVLPALPVADGRSLDVDEEITRAEAEALWAPLLDRMRGPMLRALADAGLGADRIDEVLLVGGATRMPCVAQLAARTFGRMPLRKLPPDEAVALGAAIQAALKAGDEAVGDLVVTDIAPMTLGIATSAELGRQRVPGLYTPILERATVIPTSRVQRFSTVEDGQTTIDVEVYQGEHSLCRDNRRLGSYRLTGIPPAPAGQEGIDVRFTYDLNGILEVDMTVVSTGRTESLVIEQSPGRLTPAQIAAARQSMGRLKFHPREALPNTTALARADALFVELTGNAREELGFRIAQLRAAIEQQDPQLIAGTRSALLALLDGRGQPKG